MPRLVSEQRLPAVRVALIGCLFILAPPVQAAPVGQLLDVVGKVEVYRDAGPPRHGSIGFPVQAGDQVSIAPASRAELVLYQTGQQFHLPAGSSVQVQPSKLVSRGHAAVRMKGVLGRTVTGRMQGAEGKSGVQGNVQRGGVGPVRGLSPNGAVGESQGIVLRWKLTGPVESMTLEVLDTDREPVVVETLPAGSRTFRVPGGLLKPGKDYTWTVKARWTGGMLTTASARLHILSPSERDELDSLDRPLRKVIAAHPGEVSSWLILAEIQQQFGLREEAAQSYRSILRLRPGDAGVTAALRSLEH